MSVVSSRLCGSHGCSADTTDANQQTIDLARRRCITAVVVVVHALNDRDGSNRPVISVRTGGQFPVGRGSDTADDRWQWQWRRRTSGGNIKVKSAA